MSTKIKRIAVLTGGGDCPGLNAVIRAVTKSAIIGYGLDVLGIEDGFLGLVENRIRPLGIDDVSGILTQGGTILGTSNKCNPESYRPDAGKPAKNVTGDCLRHLGEHDIDAVVCIGGDGTMTGAANFIRRGVVCMGVPKTIDNDVVGTDVTFGFTTARSVATEALDRVHSTAMSHHRAMVVEVMGRNAGWIALHAGIASGSDVILLPEIAYDIEQVCACVEERSKRGRRFTILCVSEGAKPIGGGLTIRQYDPTSPDPVRLGGVGQVVAAEIERRTGVESRCTVLGHLQRGGTPVPEDRVLGTHFGYRVVEELISGQRNRLIVVQNGRMTHIDMASVADKQRTVPIDHPLIAAARAVGTVFCGVA